MTRHPDIIFRHTDPAEDRLDVTRVASTLIFTAIHNRGQTVMVELKEGEVRNLRDALSHWLEINNDRG